MKLDNERCNRCEDFSVMFSINMIAIKVTFESIWKKDKILIIISYLIICFNN